MKLRAFCTNSSMVSAFPAQCLFLPSEWGAAEGMIPPSLRPPTPHKGAPSVLAAGQMLSLASIASHGGKLASRSKSSTSNTANCRVDPSPTASTSKSPVCPSPSHHNQPQKS